MITTASEHQVDKVEQMAGGKGHVIIEHLLGEKELDGKCGLYAKVTIEPNCTLGFHEHHGETETYYILSGEGSYNDGEKSYPVKAGDVTFCPDGTGHALDNTGDTDLVFMAHYEVSAETQRTRSLGFGFFFVCKFSSRVKSGENIR